MSKRKTADKSSKDVLVEIARSLHGIDRSLQALTHALNGAMGSYDGSFNKQYYFIRVADINNG